MVGAGADVGSDLVEDGRDLEEQRVVFGEVVEILEVGEEMGAKFPDMLAVAGIGLVALGEDAGGAQHLGGEGAAHLAGNKEIVQEALLVV